MSYLINQVEKSKRKGQLICICINSIDWRHRIIGYVIQIYPSGKFELQVIDELGQKKNKKMVLFSSIKSLEVGGIYNDNLERLMKNEFVKEKRRGKYFLISHRHVYERLQELKTSKTVCTFFFKTEFSIGIVNKVTRDEIMIKNISYEGGNDGVSFFNMAALTRIRIESNFENRIEFLSNKKAR
jgi:hypothetical protein